MNKYIGNSTQVYGVEEMRLTGGKGDGIDERADDGIDAAQVIGIAIDMMDPAGDCTDSLGCRPDRGEDGEREE